MAVAARVTAFYLGNIVADNPGMYRQISYHNYQLPVDAVMVVCAGLALLRIGKSLATATFFARARSSERTARS